MVTFYTHVHNNNNVISIPIGGPVVIDDDDWVTCR